MKKYIPVLLGLLLASCYNDKEDQLYPQPAGCDTANLTYTADIKPIMDNNCALSGCHDAVAKSFGYDLSNYNGVVAGTNGRVMGAIRHESGFLPMPKGKPQMSDCDISRVSAWINAGKPQ